MTEESIKSRTDEELAELMRYFKYDRLGFANGIFFCMLKVDDCADNNIFFPVPRQVVEEYYCRLLVEEYEQNPEFNVP